MYFTHLFLVSSRISLEKVRNKEMVQNVALLKLFLLHFVIKQDISETWFIII